MSAGWRLLLVTRSRRASALMLVGNDRAVATAQAIYAASKSEAFGFEVERMPFAFLFASDFAANLPRWSTSIRCLISVTVDPSTACFSLIR